MPARSTGRRHCGSLRDHRAAGRPGGLFDQAPPRHDRRRFRRRAAPRAARHESPSAEPVEPPDEPWRPSATPTLVRAAGPDGGLGYATRPRKAFQLQLRLLRTVAGLTGNTAARQAITAADALVATARRPPEDDRATSPFACRTGRRHGPRSTEPITPHRRFAFTHAQPQRRADGEARVRRHRQRRRHGLVRRRAA